MSVLARAARQISPTNCSRRCAMSSVDIWNNPPPEEEAMHGSHADALVFFGATGDLAYKKIFPALQAMVKRGHLHVPVIGVAKAGWKLDQLRARAQDSLEKHGGVVPPPFPKLGGFLRHLSRGHQQPNTVDLLAKGHGAPHQADAYL